MKESEAVIAAILLAAADIPDPYTRLVVERVCTYAARQRALALALAERVADQSEILSRRAEGN